MRTLDHDALQRMTHEGDTDRIKGVALDLEDEASIKSAIKEIASLTGNKVDVLVSSYIDPKNVPQKRFEVYLKVLKKFKDITFN